MATAYKLDSTFSGSDLPPIAYAVPNINAGTLLMLDFTRSECVAASGLIAADTAITDLAGIQTGLILEGTLTNKITVSAGLAWSQAAWTAAGAVKVPMPALPVDKPLMWSIWGKYTAVPSGSFQRVGKIAPAVGRDYFANTSQLYVDNGDATSVGMRTNFTVSGSGTASGPATTLAGITINTVFNYAMTWEPGVGLVEWLNGVSTRTTANAATALLTIASPTMWLAMSQGGKLYATSVERLDLSGNTAAAAVAAEYAARTGLFV